MARWLYLFSKNWNKDGALFIDFTRITKENWFSLLIGSGYVAAVKMDNYRTDDGQISVAGISEQIAGKAAYAIELDSNKTNGKFDYWKCYQIKSCRLVSGYAIFSVAVDLWGTYFPQADVSALRVTKCNMNIGNGTFDKIDYTHTLTTLTDEFYKPFSVGGMSYSVDDEGYAYMSDDDAFLVFTANCIVTDTDATDETSSVSAYYIFANTLKAIRESYPESVRTSHTSVELAARCISGIVGLPTGTTNWKMRKCEIAKAFILPASMVEIIAGGMTFKYKTPYYNTALTSIPFYYVLPTWQKMPINIPALSLDPNYKWTMGVIGEGLEVARSTQDDVAYINLTIGYDGVHVVAEQGTQQADISKAFELSLIGKSQEADASTKIGNVLSSMLGTLGSVAKGVSSKNPVVGAVGAAAGEGQKLIAKANARAEPSGSVSSADGYITFNYDANDKVTYPFYWSFYKSADDEQQRARLYGANFDKTFKDWGSLMTTPISVFFDEGKHDYPFVQATCNVTGVNDEAAKYIETMIAKGIYLGIDYNDTIKAMI